MRYPPEHKEQTRQKILDAAARTFRLNGYAATGIDAVMAEAGLTAGAFYGHFESKDALFAACLRTIFEDRREVRENGLDDLRGRKWIEGLVGNYLSVGHLDSVEEGCPLPSLAPEMGRAGKSTRTGFERQIFVWSKELEEALEIEHGQLLAPEERRSRALGAISAMVGGMTLARAMPNQDRAVAMLEGAKQMALNAIRCEEPASS